MRRHPPRYTLFPYTTLFRSFIKGGMTLIQTVVWFASLIIIILIAAMFLRSEEHTSELQSRGHLVCRLLLEKKNSSAERTSFYRYDSPSIKSSHPLFYS